MRLLWVKRATVASVLLASVVGAGLSGAAEAPRKQKWAGVVKPDAGWLTRQGISASYTINFTIDAKGKATGVILFDGGTNPAAGGRGVLNGNLDMDDLSLVGTVDGHRGLSPRVRDKARVKVVLTGFPRDDGSLGGVGILDMADLGCLNDPARAEAEAPCPRRMVPIKWTAKQ